MINLAAKIDPEFLAAILFSVYCENLNFSNVEVLCTRQDGSILVRGDVLRHRKAPARRSVVGLDRIAAVLDGESVCRDDHIPLVHDL